MTSITAKCLGCKSVNALIHSLVNVKFQTRVALKYLKHRAQIP